MTQKKISPDFIDRYLNKQAYASEKKSAGWIRIVVCLFLYILIMNIQRRSSSVDINGIVTQGQVLLSVAMVLGTSKKGYLAAVMMNGFNSLVVTIVYLTTGNQEVLPGIAIPICTIVTISIISLFSRRLNLKVAEITQQKEELGMLYEEISAAEDELIEQNQKLHEYNLAMKANEDKLNYLAFFDSLTELPNRKMILDRLELLVRISGKEQRKFALTFIDLDNFKKINDSMGHHAGDLLLKAVVQRLKTVIHPDDLLGRLGGDEFALIIQRQLKEEEVLIYLESIRQILLDGFIIENVKFNISASFGISIYPQDGDNSTEIMKCADTAMYKAKECGRNGIQFFSQEMKNEIVRKIEFENQLKEAINKEEFHLVYQAQYSPNAKQLRGIEVLARWQSPQLGFVSPAQFIPVAEETGLIIPMGEWILRTACNKLNEVYDNYQINIVMSINISAVQIMEPTFVQMVKNILEETACNPQYLEFEITESVFITSMDYVINVLTELKKLGIRIALDDFGTGYSSLNYLQLLPIDTLKIDKSFIDNINHNDAKKPIVGSIISLVHQLNISVVAEGVENEVQLHYLKNQDCDYIQGFYWGKPLHENDLNRLLQQLDV